MKYQFYAIIFDVAGNQVSSKNVSSSLSITSAIQLVTSVSISPNSAQTKNIGETFTITPTVGPANANNKNVNWTSSNTNVATVSKVTTASGTAITVTCKAAGTTTITATAADGSGKSASLLITVKTSTLKITNYGISDNTGSQFNYIGSYNGSGTSFSLTYKSSAVLEGSSGAYFETDTSINSFSKVEVSGNAVSFAIGVINNKKFRISGTGNCGSGSWKVYCNTTNGNQIITFIVNDYHITNYSVSSY